MEFIERVQTGSGLSNSVSSFRLACANLGTDALSGQKSRLKVWDASNAAAGWQEGEAFPKTSLFDVCSMQFALHYMFQNEERLDNFFHSWCPQLKRGVFYCHHHGLGCSFGNIV